MDPGGRWQATCGSLTYYLGVDRLPGGCWRNTWGSLTGYLGVVDKLPRGSLTGYLGVVDGLPGGTWTMRKCLKPEAEPNIRLSIPTAFIQSFVITTCGMLDSTMQEKAEHVDFVVYIRSMLVLSNQFCQHVFYFTDRTWLPASVTTFAHHFTAP